MRLGLSNIHIKYALSYIRFTCHATMSLFMSEHKKTQLKCSCAPVLHQGTLHPTAKSYSKALPSSGMGLGGVGEACARAFGSAASGGGCMCVCGGWNEQRPDGCRVALVHTTSTQITRSQFISERKRKWMSAAAQVNE
jgi:hypothetical protein